MVENKIRREIMSVASATQSTVFFIFYLLSLILKF